MAINSLNASSHGLSGLVSGINSQDMVDKLLSGTQAKIDKASQRKTSLQYKQSAYRDVATKLRALQTSFLSFTSKQNLRSNAFYNTMNALITPPNGVKNPAFSATATSSAKAGTMKVDYIQQLARAYSLKTTGNASGKVEGAFDQDAAKELYDAYTGKNATLNIKVGDKELAIESITTELAGMTSSQVADYLNGKFAEKGLEATAVFEDNKLNIIAKNEKDFIVVKGADGTGVTDKTFAMQMFGTSYASLSGKGKLSASIDTDNYMPSLTVNLDGRDQKVRLDLTALKEFKTSGNSTDLLNNINAGLKKAFGTGMGATATTVDGKAGILFSSGSASQHFTISGNYRVTKALGIKGGISNKLNANMTIGDLNFNEPLLGNKQTFTINGVEFSYGSNASLNSIMNDINNSRAGVKMSYLESEDRFVIENAEAGAGRDGIDIQQLEGNLLSGIFGLKGANSATGLAVSKNMEGNTLTAAEQSTLTAKIKEGGSFIFNINGKNYSVKVDKKDSGDYTLEEFTEALNKKLATQFGEKDDVPNVSISYNSGKFTVASNDGYVIKVDKDDDTSLSKLGFAVGSSTLVTDGGAQLSDSKIAFGDGKIVFNAGGTTVEIAGSDLDGLTMDQVATKIQTAAREAVKVQALADGKTAAEADAMAAKVEVAFDSRISGFAVSNVDAGISMEMVSGTGSKNLDKLFGTNTVTFSAPAVAGATDEKNGLNAIVSINNNILERNTNSFTYEGVSFTLNATTARDDNGTTVYDSAGEVSVTRDTQQIVDGLKDFFKMYNETIDTLNEMYRAEPTYKKYPPLTSKQLGEMSDREIEKWEEKSKEGLLRGDALLESVTSKMRSALYNRPDGSSLAIYDLGITAGYFSKGKFEIEDEGKLKAAIENDPEAVRRLFSGENGLMEVLDSVISDATRISAGSPGTFVSMAGSNVSDSDSKIFKEMKSIDKQLEGLEKRYWSEYNRYWKQFNTMENLIQKMNTQSSWLSQQLSGM